MNEVSKMFSALAEMHVNIFAKNKLQKCSLPPDLHKHQLSCSNTTNSAKAHFKVEKLNCIWVLALTSWQLHEGQATHIVQLNKVGDYTFFFFFCRGVLIMKRNVL